MRRRKMTMLQVFKNPRYRGKHIVLVAGKIFTSTTGRGALRLLEKARKKYPKAVPEVAYLPKSHSLILWT